MRTITSTRLGDLLEPEHHTLTAALARARHEKHPLKRQAAVLDAVLNYLLSTGVDEKSCAPLINVLIGVIDAIGKEQSSARGGRPPKSAGEAYLLAIGAATMDALHDCGDSIATAASEVARISAINPRELKNHRDNVLRRRVSSLTSYWYRQRLDALRALPAERRRTEALTQFQKSADLVITPPFSAR